MRVYCALVKTAVISIGPLGSELWKTSHGFITAFGLASSFPARPTPDRQQPIVADNMRELSPRNNDDDDRAGAVEHEAWSRSLENKLQILRIACTDRPISGLEYRQTSSQVTHRAMPDKVRSMLESYAN